MPAFCFYKTKGYDQNQLLPITLKGCLEPLKTRQKFDIG
jgi:hypothetical protein